MGIKKNADASYNLGLGVSDANDYKGFAGQNEITIQLTADGATDKSMDALNYLKTFAINQAAAGLPIKPSASVSISANGYTKALEADDFEITETGVKIGGIEYTASTDSWDFTNALVPSGGGGGGSGAFEIFFEVYWDDDASADVVICNKTLEEINAAKTAGQYITARAMIWQTSPSKFPIGFDVAPEYNWYEFVFEWIDNDPSFNYMYSGRIEFDRSTLKWKWTYSQYTVTPYVPSP